MSDPEPTFAESVEQFKQGVLNVLNQAGPESTHMAELTERFADDLLALCCHIHLAQSVEDRELVLWQDDRWQVLLMGIGLAHSKRLDRLDPPAVGFEAPDDPG